MKPLVLLVLVAAAAALYFGYEPYDLVRLFEPKPTAVAKRARATAPEPAPETPRTQNTSVVVATAPDGGLEHRWSPYPSASPAATVKP